MKKVSSLVSYAVIESGSIECMKPIDTAVVCSHNSHTLFRSLFTFLFLPFLPSWLLLGLYRLSGVNSKVQRLFHLVFEKGRFGDLSAEDCAPRTITSAVKRYLSSLPVRKGSVIFNLIELTLRKLISLLTFLSCHYQGAHSSHVFPSCSAGGGTQPSLTARSCVGDKPRVA